MPATLELIIDLTQLHPHPLRDGDTPQPEPPSLRLPTQMREGLTGLDQHQVRRWTSWHRWTILAMLAHAFLAVVAAFERIPQPAPTGWIALTCNEIHHLLDCTEIGGRGRHCLAGTPCGSLLR
jgi:hypothetical protein